MKIEKCCFAAMMAAVVLAAGCATSKKDFIQTRESFAAGSFTEANGLAGKHLDQKPENDLTDSALLWRLHRGAIYGAEGNFPMAEKQWEIAQPAFEYSWENERFSILGDTLGVIVPADGKKYYAKPHEGVMIYTYKMLNALQTGDPEEAVRHLVAAMEFSEEVMREAAQRVEERKAKGLADPSDLALNATSSEFAKSENDEAKEGKSLSADATTSLVQMVRDKQREADLEVELAGYGNYMNPLTGLMTYILLKTHGTGFPTTAVNDAKRELEDLVVFAPHNSVVKRIKSDVRKPLTNTVFVFFETGMAPWQEEIKHSFWIPPVTDLKWFPSSFNVAWPELRANPDFVPYMGVSAAGGETVKTELLANFDAIVKQSFDDAWPGVVARQVSQAVYLTVLNAAVNYTAQRVADKNIQNENTKAWAKIGANVATHLAAQYLTSADTRSWDLLPKQVQVAMLDIPADRKLALSFPANAGKGGWKGSVTLGQGDVMAVWVKSVGRSQAAPLVTQFKFK